MMSRAMSGFAAKSEFECLTRRSRVIEQGA